MNYWWTVCGCQMVGHSYPKPQQCEGCIAFILWLTFLSFSSSSSEPFKLTHQQLYNTLAKALNAFF